MDSKPIRLVQQLLARSNEGKVRWEKTVDSGEYQAAFPHYSVRTFSRFNSETDVEDYFLQIYNEEGELVEEISDGEFTIMLGPNATPSGFKIMKDLYEVARRTAMGVEAALDTILAELEVDKDATPF
jgi:hypothetical protein